MRKRLGMIDILRILAVFLRFFFILILILDVNILY